jgi:hypothetical protein
MNSYFGMATVCPRGYRVNKRYRAKRGQKQCLKGAPKKSLAQLRAIARSKDVSVYKRRKDGMGFTRTPLTMKALKYRLTKLADRNPDGSRVPAYFGRVEIVCPAGKVGNRKTRRCRNIRPQKLKLADLQALAMANSVSMYKRRKDDMGFTRTPLTVKALKYRLTKMRVPYRVAVGRLV